MSSSRSSPSGSFIDELRRTLRIRGGSSSSRLDRDGGYELACSESYLTWLEYANARHAGLLKHVLGVLDKAISSSEVRKRLEGKYVINPIFFPPKSEEFIESVQFVRLVIVPKEGESERKRKRSTSSAAEKPLELAFLWDAFQSEDKNKIIADISFFELLPESESQFEEHQGRKKWITHLRNRIELEYCHAPPCKKMFLLNHGEPLGTFDDKKLRRRGTKGVDEVVKPALARLRTSFGSNVPSTSKT